ncbi:MAG TPA: 2'-5' RNA ligase family protein [Anaerolineaceae bacterium]
MKAAIVLLSDYAVQNYIRQFVYQLNTRWDVPFFASLLPAHISLKQPFTFENIEALERFFDSFAASIPPFEIDLDGLYAETWSGYGILGLNVVETPALRALHNRLNAELPGVVKDASAAHDGAEYHFHLTIEMGKVDGLNPFQALYDEISDKRVQLQFTARALALFFYPQRSEFDSTFITYRVQPLAG